MNSININKYSTSLKRQALAICSSVFLLVIFMLGVQEFLNISNRNIDSLINISGRQRMLSQKLAFQKINGSDKINQTLEKFIKSQDYIIQNSTEKIQNLYSSRLSKVFDEYVELISKEELSNNSKLILDSEKILILLDQVVFLFEKESNKNQIYIMYSNIFFIFFIIIVLLFLYFNLLKKQRLKIISSLTDFLNDKNKALENSKAKSQFLANMSHELRTPLNGIVGISRALRETNLNVDQMKSLGVILKAGELLSGIINNVLDYTKFEMKGIELNVSTFSIRDIIQEIIELLQPLANEKKLSLEYIEESSTPDFVSSDSLRIKQLLINLVSNAIKFTKDGGVVVRSSMLNGDILFEVNDTGLGIDQKNINAIFNDFSQIEDTYVKTQEGTGLGLSISKMIVDVLEGNIEVDSVLGSGSTFRVCLNLEIKESLEDFALEKGDDALFLGKLGKVLIVEDNKINQLVIKVILKNLDIDFDIAENGQEAIEFSQKKHYSLILMDISMPVMDGFEATWRIREFLPDIPIFCISANTFEEDKRKAVESGMNEFLKKPLSKNELIRHLNDYFPRS